ncbi:MAG: hypothetical protein WC827_04315 [Candidatus Paceibacterota bacterium]|jgi:ribulose-phosphate 3-epimerase
MIEVIPAIIPESFEDLKDKMSFVNGITHMVQIDVCDGKFVPSKSWPYTNDYENDFKKIVEESDGFPFWQSLDFEVDLMVKDPEVVFEDWIRAGAKRMVLHVESSEKLLNFVREIRNKYGYYGDSIIGIEVGIALNIKTPNEEIYKFFELNGDGRSLVDFVQFMGIRDIGYQGQYFDERVLGKIRELRQSYPDTIISVDGGVTFENAHEIVEAGVNRLVSGSAIYDSENIKESIEEMRII